MTPADPQRVERLLEGLATGERGAISEALNLVDDRRSEEREAALRLLDGLARRTGPDAKIMSHYGWVRCTPMQHFTDIIIGGEGVENMVASKGSYYDLLTPEMFRATFSPYIYGVKTAFLNMLARAAKSSPDAITRFAKDPEAQRATRHVYGYSVVHDVGIWDSHKETRVVRETVWEAQDALGWDEQVRFHPYWHEGSGVEVVRPESERILASAYSRQASLMLAVLNDNDQVHNVKLALDLDKLGVEPGLLGRDAFGPSKAYTLGATWRDTVAPRGFRLVVWSRR